MKADLILLTNYLRMIVFSYFSTHELLTKVSVMNQATRKQLLNRGGSYGLVAVPGAPAPMLYSSSARGTISERTVKLVLKDESCAAWPKP